MGCWCSIILFRGLIFFVGRLILKKYLLLGILMLLKFVFILVKLGGVLVKKVVLVGKGFVWVWMAIVWGKIKLIFIRVFNSKLKFFDIVDKFWFL